MPWLSGIAQCLSAGIPPPLPDGSRLVCLEQLAGYLEAHLVVRSQH